MKYEAVGTLVIDTTTGEIVYEAGHVGTKAAWTCAGKLNTEHGLGVLVDVASSVQEIEMMESAMKMFEDMAVTGGTDLLSTVMKMSGKDKGA